MIANNDHYIAAYSTSCGCGTYRQIIAWDENGFPLIVGDRGLMPASSLPGYIGVRFRKTHRLYKMTQAQEAEEAEAAKKAKEAEAAKKAKEAEAAKK